MPITPEILDQILKDYENPEDLLSENGLLQQLTKALVERALNGELTHHLGYEKHDPAGHNSGNSRNGQQPDKPIAIWRQSLTTPDWLVQKLQLDKSVLGQRRLLFCLCAKHKTRSGGPNAQCKAGLEFRER